MNVGKHIIRIASVWIAVIALVAMPALSAQNHILMVEIDDGDTAFMIDMQAYEAWWIVGDCRRSLPLEKTLDISKNITNSITTEVTSDVVRMGSHQVNLRQQFKFNIATQPASIEVFNSVRNGWSSVPVQVNKTCTQEPTCRARTELPKC